VVTAQPPRGLKDGVIVCVDVGVAVKLGESDEEELEPGEMLGVGEAEGGHVCFLTM
jgi:hypothetical protein